ncbi:7 transmembrane receptor (rhodopsin family) domain-containing protein [Ditylenchus destructor]|nr:7 transmembrane receptor (rhodopsin family) domain-containing protein [Ditylenchus destructor]
MFQTNHRSHIGAIIFYSTCIYILTSIPVLSALFHQTGLNAPANNHLNVTPEVAAGISGPASMVLGALLSLQTNLLNSTNSTSARGHEIRALPAIDLLAGEVLTVTTIASANISPESSESPRNEFMPVFELVLGAVTYLIIIAMTVIGNTLVVVAVFSYRPLKKVQNYFLVSLAASDMAVALLVMPLHVVKFLADGRWLLGVTICQLFTTFDILLCTSSILNLCAIALDRYWAIHNPLEYAQKRTPRLVCSIILVVWLASAIISVPPLIGWNDWTSQSLLDHCELTTEKAFVVFSASGSFFVPLAIMVVVYLKIFISARQRIRTNRGRSALMKIKQSTASSKSPFPNFRSMASNTKTTTLTATPRAASLVLGSSGGGSATLQQVTKVKTKRSASQTNSIGNPRKSTKTASGGQAQVTRNNSDTAAVQMVAARLFLQNNLGGDLNIDTDGPTSLMEDHPTSYVREPMSMIADEKTNTTYKSSSSDDDASTARCGSVVPVESKTPPNKAHFSLGPEGNPCRKPSGAMTNGTGNSGPTGPQEQLTTSVLKNREKISVAKEKRAAKTIAVIIFVFTFCWLPFFCAYVILPFCESCSLHPKVHQAFVWLGYINSCLNPFIYAILNLEFRRAFRKILCPKAFLVSQKRRSIGADR